MRTRLLVHSTNTLISDRIPLVTPKQEITEVTNRLLDGSWHVQTIGDPAHSFEIELVIPGDRREELDTLAARKTTLRLERHGEQHLGIISGAIDWEQLIGSTEASRAVLKGKLLLLLTGGE